jgi:divalent metal cation (Fe/Co/Zn/Cd) transporter
VIDPTIASTERGIWAIKWSFIGLMATALFQVVIVVLSGSVALLADTIHNFGDASTAIPLWIAFLFARLRPSKRFSFGYGRVEDLAGVLVVLTILFSAVVAGYESVNQAVAVFRIRVGREIGSVALIADGYHARVDGWTSLAVLFGAAGVWLGYPLADPIVGILITLAIAGIVWKSGVAVFTRALDGVEPEYIDEIEHTTMHVSGVVEVTDVRARWIGHRLHAEVNVAVDSELSVVEAHEISEDVHHRLLHQLPYLARATIHIDPVERAGEVHHRIPEHAHDNLEAHSH